MTSADITPIRTPDADAMREHVTHLFTHHQQYADGKIELAWTDPETGALNKAQYFDTDQIDALVDRAVELNKITNINVYIGAALRDPDCPPMGRSSDDDFYALTALYCDMDDKGAAEDARTIINDSGDINPTFTVITGTYPHLRAQMWWRLVEPITDTNVTQNMLRAIAVALGGDVKVCNPGRVMRLGGSIAWPVKAGRVTEQTKTMARTNPADVNLDHMMLRFPETGLPFGSETINTGQTADTDVVHAKSGMGLDGKITDGREAYMRDTVLAVFIEWVGETGSIPTQQELYDAAWPQYESNVDFSRPGRDKDEFVRKVAYTLNRFNNSRLPEMKTIEDVVARYRVKSSPKAPFTNPSQDDATSAPDTDTTDELEALTMQELMNRDRPRWLIDGVLPETGLLFVYGPPKSGKSFVTLDMSLRISHGMEWFGRKTRAGGVLYVAGEGVGGMRNRVRAWHSHNDVKPNELVRVVPHAINLTDETDIIRLVNTVRIHVGDARLVVIDTLARSSPGVDENDAKEIGLLIQACDRIWQELGLLVVLVHHAGKDAARGLRGSSALLGAADGVLCICRDEEGPGGGIEIEAMKDGESGDDIRFKTTQVEWLEDLTEQSSMIVEDGDPAPVQSSMWPSKDICREILYAISAAWDAGHPWSLAPQTKIDGRYAPTRISARFDVSENVVVNMVQAWLNNDVLAVELVDTHSKRKGLKKTGDIDL